MKNTKRLVFCLYFIFLTICVIADDSLLLQDRLRKIKYFYADFTQEIISVTGNLLKKNEGKLWIKYPNFLKCHVVYPHENIIIFDKQLFWFYHPSLKQLILNDAENVVDNILFILLFHDDIQVLSKYNIRQINDCFFILSKLSDNNFEKIVIEITSVGVIKNCFVFDKCGQRINYYLKNQDITAINTNEFCFIPPEDIKIDDQRSHIIK